MKHHPLELGPFSDPITRKAVDLTVAVAERSRGNTELLLSLARAPGHHERVHRRYRHAVITSLSRIETLAEMILVGQSADRRLAQPDYEELVKADAASTEEFVSQQS